MSTPGADRIADERCRQISVEGWTPEHDAQHTGFELTRAAICYGQAAIWNWARDHDIPHDPWPWEDRFWKPSDDPIRNLVKAGALIAAELDRLLAVSGLAETPESNPT